MKNAWVWSRWVMINDYTTYITFFNWGVVSDGWVLANGWVLHCILQLGGWFFTEMTTNRWGVDDKCCGVFFHSSNSKISFGDCCFCVEVCLSNIPVWVLEFFYLYFFVTKQVPHCDPLITNQPSLRQYQRVITQPRSDIAWMTIACDILSTKSPPKTKQIPRCLSSFSS